MPKPKKNPQRALREREVPTQRAAETTWITERAGTIHILQAAPLAELDWLVHGFSTRLGGTSPLDGGRVLNLGPTDWDTGQNVQANRREFLAALGAEQMKLMTLRQFHSDVIHTVDAPPGYMLRGDAAITGSAGLVLAIQTADCVPILLLDPRQRVVAAVHAGWRGTLRRIAEKTVGRMQMVFGARPEDLLAVLGPAIRQCCYQVGPEVAQAYASQFVQAGEWFEGPFERFRSGDDPSKPKWLSIAPPGHDPPPPPIRLDLVAANRWQLLRAGVPEPQITSSELCTACRTDLLFSYRKEKRTGRLMAAIGVRLASSRNRPRDVPASLGMVRRQRAR